MSDVPRPVRPWVTVALAVLMVGVGIAGALSRKALVPLLVLTCIPLAASVGVRQVAAFFRPSPFMTAAGALAAWAAVSNVWGYGSHFDILARVIVTLGLGFIAVRGMALLPGSTAALLERWIVTGGWLLAVFLMEEWVTGGRVSTIFHPDPAFQAAMFHYPRILDFAGGGAVVVATTAFAVAVLTFVHAGSWTAAAAYLVGAFIGCAVMPMAAAPLAMGLGAVAFAVAYFFRRFAFAALFGLFTLYLYAAPVIFAFIEPVPPSAPAGESVLEAQDEMSRYARLGIWNHVARLVQDAPVLGHGFGAARDLSARNEKLPGADLAAIPIHPHSGVLQVWLELGLVGVLLVTVLLFFAWRATRPLWDRPLAAATVAATLTACAVPLLLSFSLWNTWWLACLAFAAVFAMRAVKVA
jgi:O-antigen ligase